MIKHSHHVLFSNTTATMTAFHQQLIPKTCNQRRSSSISTTNYSLQQINETESYTEEDDNIQEPSLSI